jgi:hypothetical protein
MSVENTTPLTKQEIEEALTISQRMKRKRTFRRIRPKIERGKRLAKRRMANRETIEKRAKRRARNAMFKKLARKSKSKTSFAQRKSIETRLAKKSGAISRMARKMRKDVRRDDRNKRKAKK